MFLIKKKCSSTTVSLAFYPASRAGCINSPGFFPWLSWIHQTVFVFVCQTSVQRNSLGSGWIRRHCSNKKKVPTTAVSSHYGCFVKFSSFFHPAGSCILEQVKLSNNSISPKYCIRSGISFLNDSFPTQRSRKNSHYQICRFILLKGTKFNKQQK